MEKKGGGVMGYIIPYTHYTYQHYAKRLEDRKESPYHIDHSYKVVFHRINEDHPNDKYKHIQYNKRKNKAEGKEYSFIMNEKDRIALTGKGGYLNESI